MSSTKPTSPEKTKAAYDRVTLDALIVEMETETKNTRNLLRRTTEKAKSKSDTSAKIKKGMSKAKKAEQELQELWAKSPTPFKQDIPHVGSHYVEDVRYRDVGWRRLILPVPYEVFFKTKKINVPARNYFGDLQSTTLVQIMHFQVYSYRAKAYIPVFECIYSPWMIKHKIKPESLLEVRSVTEFSRSLIEIAGFETQQAVADKETETLLKYAAYDQLEHTQTDVQKMVDDQSAHISMVRQKGQRPPTEMSNRMGDLWEKIRKYAWFIILAIMFIAVYGMIVFMNRNQLFAQMGMISYMSMLRW